MYSNIPLHTMYSWSNRKSSGIPITKEISTKMSNTAKETVMKELEGHTGDTDSEAEG